MEKRADYATPLPLDIKPAWLNPIRCLQAHARTQGGLAILTIKFIVDADANPIAWSTPEKTCLEPKSAADTILKIFAP